VSRAKAGVEYFRRRRSIEQIALQQIAAERREEFLLAACRT
jgi:hypothetical protein